MTELNRLTSQRGKLKGRITRLASYICDNVDNIDVDQLSLRLEKAIETWDDFDEVQTQIEDLCNDSESAAKYREEFENLYFTNVARAKKMLTAGGNNLNTSAGGDSLPTGGKLEPHVGPEAAIKLAPLAIPSFSGAYSEWSAFEGVFKAIVHENAALSDIQKFFYLRSALTGEAAKVILSLETTAAQYKIAWSRLTERYDNKKVLIQVHVRALFDLEPIKRESCSALRGLTDSIINHINALETLGQTPQKCGAILIHLILSKLDPISVRKWEVFSAEEEEPEVQTLLKFLKSRFRILESINMGKQEFIQPVARNKCIRSNGFAVTSEMKCFVCKQAHTVYKCPTLLSLSVRERIKKVSELNLCKICLRVHAGERCTQRRCPKCSQPHNSLLHIPRENKQVNEVPLSQSSTGDRGEQPVGNMVNNNTPSTSYTLHTHTRKVNTSILLSTATVIIYDHQRRPLLCRALLDSGSQHNFMTESVAQCLRLKRRKTLCVIEGINAASHTSSHVVSATVKSRASEYSSVLDFFILPKLTSNLPAKSVNTASLNIPNDIMLADPSFDRPNSIDLILGAEIFYDLLCDEKIKTVDNGPILQKTHFGWVVSGSLPSHHTQSSVVLFSSGSKSVANLENKIAKFWNVEELANVKPLSLEEKACQLHFKNNIKRDIDGRFVVALPFKDNFILGKSYQTALKRFLSLERRFQTNVELKNRYSEFIKEYLQLNHMEKVAANETTDNTYYIPHHAIFKESSQTTKIRVVFDASCKTDNGASLNDVLLKGPCIQDELVEIMIRFRAHKYVFCADIEKMYRQIWISENQRDFQRILWRDSPEHPVQVFRLKTVTYGVITSSYLATGCLKKLAEEEAGRYPEACRALQNDFYMDDLLSGADTLDKANKLRDDLLSVTKSAGFQLRQWRSNEPLLLNGVPVNLKGVNDTAQELHKDITKILGLYWNQKNDSYQYKVKPMVSSERITKRAILSEIASLFDPLGLVAPVIIRFKIIMQQLWQLKIDWDHNVPDNIEREWKVNRESLCQINKLLIPRRIIGDGSIRAVEIHGFADASIVAYGACLYLRVIQNDGQCIVNLICAKSRVAPLKSISLPRLELLAAVLLARLVKRYGHSLRLNISNCFYWSDSTVVLSWIASPSSRWKTFVSHRVGEIHELTSISQWNHVRTEDNAADVVSRGTSPQQLKNLTMWWSGPSWLSEENGKWPRLPLDKGCKTEVLSEERTVSKVFVSAVTYDLSILERYSSLMKLQRVLVYCYRFVNNTLAKSRKIERKHGPIQADEIENANNCMIKVIQEVYFNEEIQSIKNGRLIKPKSKLIRLNPFLDEMGILRVGGRLRNAVNLSLLQRHPVILPAKCEYTKLVFMNEHLKLMHGGPQSMLASVRLKYWPLNGRNIARQVTRTCVSCFKYRPVVVQPIMGDLPAERLEPSRAFLKTGVDFAGPFYVKSSQRRKAPVNKAYSCIFVCFATKAVHIELVSDLSTSAFISALQRFCDRRGLCSDIYCDNATNFVGASRQLEELRTLFMSNEHQTQVINNLSKLGIQWHFIPPRSPHFGGLWEAAVKSLKAHLFKTLGNALLTFEELNTVLVRVEAMLNSRPLTPLSNDPNDFSVLTPGHFLIGDSLNAWPERDETTTTPNRLTRWRRVVQLSQQLWSVWSREYLQQIQERSKWSSTHGPRLQQGSVVLIREYNTPPLKWPMGRIVSVVEGTDGEVRVALVRTGRGVFKRAVRNLCPLPFEGNRPNCD